MIDVEDAIRAYRNSAHSAATLSTRCHNMKTAARTADDFATGAARTLGGVSSDATRALDETITKASLQLRTIAGTLEQWAQAADAYSDEAGRIVAKAETHWSEIRRNRRTLARAEDEALEAPENAIAYGHRQRALEQEIEQDYVALGTLLGRLREEDARLARALLEGQDRIGFRLALSIRALGARTQDIYPFGDAEFVWELLAMGVEDWGISGYGYVEDLHPFIVDEDGNPVISPSDVSQGRLGDCWFIATLMAVADQRPETIERLITLNPETGMYTVTFYDEDLQPHPVEVDGRLFLENDGNTFGAGWSEDKVLWPAIVEKALAEYWGGYPEIEGDFPRLAIRLITGSDDIHTDWFNEGPAEWFDGDDTNPEAMSATLDGGGIAVAWTPKFPAGEAPLGLAGGHAYQVVDVTDDIVTIQNPHGTVNHPPIQLSWDDFHRHFRGVEWTD